MDCFDEVGSIDIGNESERHCTIAVVLQRFVGHYWSEIRATDTNVDHVCNALAAITPPLAVAYPLGKLGHLVEHEMDIWNDILPIDNDRLAFWGPKRHVQHGTIFGDVNLLAAEHRIDAAAQICCLGQIQQ